MAIDRVETSQRPGLPERLPMAELIDRLSRFEGPPEQFLVNLLAVQCQVAGAVAGAILRLGAEGRPEILAVFPPLAEGVTVPTWLAQAVEVSPQVIGEGLTSLRPVHGPDDLYGQPAERHLVLVPLRGSRQVRGVSAFLVETQDAQALAAGRERLELTTSLLSLYEMRLTLQQRQMDLRRLRMALETLAAVNEHERFAGAAMAACNEAASRWQCDRVSVGFVKGRYIYLKAMSHTEKFSRKMKVIQDIEAAMEECFDQDVEVSHPAEPDSTCVNRAARELSTRHGPLSVLSLPLRRSGEPTGVMMVERGADRPFRLEEIESLRLTCELCTPRLSNLYERDRWFGARAAATARKGLAKLVGPTHTWAKALVVGVVAAIVFLAVAKGEYTAEGMAVIEPIRKQIIQAPFDGVLMDVLVEPGDEVSAGVVLARLNTEDLQGELYEAQAEWASHQERADAASQQGKAAEKLVAEAERDQAAARIAVLEYRIRRASITSPIAGTVVRGDLKRQIGTSVEIGQVLFEVAPLQTLRAELAIPEDQIADVTEAHSGQLATARYPGRRIAFQVERIHPMAEVAEQKNVFKVRVRLVGLDLAGAHEWLRPGMEGVGKVHLGRRPYAWLWTRKLVNWVRMKLWL